VRVPLELARYAIVRWIDQTGRSDVLVFGPAGNGTVRGTEIGDLFEENPYRGLRRVIDISGDGPNNDGAPVTGARDAALEKGIIINGLPIMVKEPSLSTTDIENLDLYYEDCVIGGPGAFIMTIKDREKFQAAIRTKLVREVAGLTPESGIVPAAEKEPRVPCLIGEKKSQERGRR